MTRSSLAAGFEVAVASEEVYLGAIHALLFEVAGEVFDDGYGAVAATGASYA
jgi:hypothetical protein